MEDDKIIPQSLKALIDDTIRDRELIMNNKVDNHKRHTDLIRQLNSLVSVVETQSEFKDSKVRLQIQAEEKVEQDKDIKTQHHINGKIKYKGRLNSENEMHGRGFLNHYNGSLKYKGEFVNGYPNGQDSEVFHFNGNLEYKGPIVNGFYKGKGNQYHENGALRFSGIFKENKFQGSNTVLYYDNGNIEYVGPLIDSIYNGLGTLYHKNGNLEFEGQLLNGGPNAEKCLIYHANGKIRYRGACKDGHFHGYGCLWNAKGYLQYEGKFHHGKPLGDYVQDDRNDNQDNGIGDLDISEITNNVGDTMANITDNEKDENKFYSNYLMLKPGPANDKLDGLTKQQPVTETSKPPKKKPAKALKPSAKKGTKNMQKKSAQPDKKRTSQSKGRPKSPSMVPLVPPTDSTFQKNDNSRSQYQRTNSLNILSNKKKQDEYLITERSPGINEPKSVRDRKTSLQRLQLSQENFKSINKEPKSTSNRSKRTLTQSPTKSPTKLKSLYSSQLQQKFDAKSEGIQFFEGSKECLVTNRDFYQHYEEPESLPKNHFPRVNAYDISPHKNRSSEKIITVRKSPSIPDLKLSDNKQIDPNQYIKNREYKDPKPKIKAPPKPDIRPPLDIEWNDWVQHNIKGIKELPEIIEEKKILQIVAPTLKHGEKLCESPLYKKIKEDGLSAYSAQRKPGSILKTNKMGESSKKGHTKKLSFSQSESVMKNIGNGLDFKHEKADSNNDNMECESPLIRHCFDKKKSAWKDVVRDGLVKKVNEGKDAPRDKARLENSGKTKGLEKAKPVAVKSRYLEPAKGKDLGKKVTDPKVGSRSDSSKNQPKSSGKDMITKPKVVESGQKVGMKGSGKSTVENEQRQKSPKREKSLKSQKIDMAWSQVKKEKNADEEEIIFNGKSVIVVMDHLQYNKTPICENVDILPEKKVESNNIVQQDNEGDENSSSDKVRNTVYDRMKVLSDSIFRQKSCGRMNRLLDDDDEDF